MYCDDELNDNNDYSLDSVAHICKLSACYEKKSEKEQNNFSTLYINQFITFGEDCQGSTFTKLCSLSGESYPISLLKHCNNTVEIYYGLIYNKTCDKYNDKVTKCFESEVTSICNQCDKLGLGYKLVKTRKYIDGVNYKLIINTLPRTCNSDLEEDWAYSNQCSESVAIEKIYLQKNTGTSNLHKYGTNSVLLNICSDQSNILNSEVCEYSYDNVASLWNDYLAHVKQVTNNDITQINNKTEYNFSISRTIIGNSYIEKNIDFVIAENDSCVEITFLVSASEEDECLVKQHVQHKINEIKKQCENACLSFSYDEKKNIVDQIIYVITIK